MSRSHLTRSDRLFYRCAALVILMMAFSLCFFDAATARPFFVAALLCVTINGDLRPLSIASLRPILTMLLDRLPRA